MGIETLWRGHSHWTMGVLGGVCFALIGLLDEWQDHPPLWLQMLEGAAIVTALELLVGLVVNRWLGWNVWDYSDMPLNLWGQVCLQFAVAWFFLSAAAVWLENALHRLAAWLAHRRGR
ncbi:MAG TPA: putative ABC transporter permease [Candidatus Agathobaculum pullicola]|nr:putative ABC transporter permease [Candidatus Agathobaculum pullicola]